jgi:NarL family two-component system response regulator LiaR
MNGRIRLIVIDDHRVVQSSLASYLGSFPDLEVVATAASGEEALPLIETLLPDVAVVDLRMPGGIDGVETTRRIRSLSPHTQVVILTAHTDEAPVLAALRAGAVGYVRKDSEPEVFLAAIRAAARGQSMLDPTVAGAVLSDLVRGSGVGETLSQRETEVLRELAKGRTNKEIAKALGVSEETVKTHVGNILSKLQLEHRTQAVVYAIKQGLVSLDDL